MPTLPMLTEPTRTLVTLEDIREAAARIRGIVRRTPLAHAAADPRAAALLLKCENMQVAGAFKIRGRRKHAGPARPRSTHPRRDHLLVGQPRPGPRVCRRAARGACRGGHAHQRSVRQGQRHARVRRRGGVRGHDVSRSQAGGERLQQERGLVMVPPSTTPGSSPGKAPSGWRSPRIARRARGLRPGGWRRAAGRRRRLP